MADTEGVVEAGQQPVVTTEDEAVPGADVETGPAENLRDLSFAAPIVGREFMLNASLETA